MALLVINALYVVATGLKIRRFPIIACHKTLLIEQCGEKLVEAILKSLFASLCQRRQSM